MCTIHFGIIFHSFKYNRESHLLPSVHVYWCKAWPTTRVPDVKIFPRTETRAEIVFVGLPSHMSLDSCGKDPTRGGGRTLSEDKW